MNRRLKKLCGFLVVFAIATAILVFFYQRRGTSEVVRTVAERGTLQTDAHATRVAQRPNTRGKSPRGPDVRPVPHGGLAGETLDCREILLPPGTNGVPLFRREFVFRPAGRETPVRIEETYEGSGEKARLVHETSFAANRLLVTVDGQRDFAVFRREMMAQGYAVSDPLMTLKSKGNARITLVVAPDADFETLAKIDSAVLACAPLARTCNDLVMKAFDAAPAGRYPSELFSSAETNRNWAESIGLPEAWAVRTETPDVIVAVLDSGCNTNHVDLRENVVPGKTFFGDKTSSFAVFMNGHSVITGAGQPFSSDGAYDGWSDGIPRPSTAGKRILEESEYMQDYSDGWGHGTHCCGIVGAAGDNGGAVGIVWKAKVMPMKWMAPQLSHSYGIYSWKSPTGSFCDAIRCMNYAAEHGAKVLSCSFGSSITERSAAIYENTFSDVLDELKARDVIVVCAAGNGDDDDRPVDIDANPIFPACCTADNLVSVAYCTADGALAANSNYGLRGVDIAAPGVNVFSTCVASRLPGGETDEAYAVKSGTSMATPVVAGCLALLKAAFPEESYAETISRLYGSGDELPGLKDKISTGRRLNIGNAFRSGDWRTCAAPYGVAASSGDYKDRIIVTWKSTDGAYGRVWRADSATGELQPVSGWVSTAEGFVDRTVQCGKTYWYAVQVSRKPMDVRASALSARTSGYAEDRDLDRWDPTDDTAAGATELAPENEEHRLSENDAEDWYRIRLEYGRTYDFSAICAEGGSVSLALFLGDQLVASGKRPGFTVSTRAAVGDYWLCVTSAKAAKGKTIRYRLSYSAKGGYDVWDRDGADDTAAGAGGLAAPDLTPRRVESLTLCDFDLADWFRVDLEEGYAYVFRTDNAGVRAQLFAAGDLVTPVAESDESGCLRVTPDASGAHYLKLSRIGSRGVFAYALTYQLEPSERNLQLTPEEYLELIEPDGADWPGNPFLTTEADGVTPVTALPTNVAGVVRWAFNEEWLSGIGEGVFVTNLVELCSAEGRRLMWGHAVWEGSLDWTIVDFRTHLPPLPVGSYFVRLTVNRDINGNVSYRETDESDNVAELAFTVTDPARQPDGLAIDGNAELVGDGTPADYRCVATYPDGPSGEVAAEWLIVQGEELVRAERVGNRLRLAAYSADEPATVVIRAVFGDWQAEKTIALVADARPKEDVFGPPVYHPDGEMSVAVGILRLNGRSAGEGDRVAAYAVLPQGRLECRGVASAAADGTFAMRIFLLSEGETIVFMALDAQGGDAGEVAACLQAVPSRFGLALGTAENPFVVDAVRNDPFGVQQFSGMLSSAVYAAVTVGGLAAGEGDILAVYEGGTLIGKQLIKYDSSVGMVSVSGGAENLANGVPRSLCSLTLYLSEGPHDLTFKVWDAVTGELHDCDERVTLEGGRSAGLPGSPLDLSAERRQPSAMSEESSKTIRLSADPGEPGVTHTVTFDLAGGADRIGGGALVQTVADGAGAELPEIACRAGHVFRFWNYPANNVRADRAITACYETATRSAPATVDFAWLDRRLGPGSHTLAEYEAAALAPTGKTGADGHPLAAWEEYLAGTDPDRADDVFRATIEMVGGVPQVGWSPDLNSNGVRRLYTVWGKAKLDDGDWTTPPAADARFFKVTVDEP